MNPQVTRLNIIPGAVMPIVNVNQYDKSKGTLKFEVYDGSVPFAIPQDIGVTILGTKPDKTGFSYDAIVTGDSEVTANIEQQMTVLAGDVECELRFMTDGASIIQGTLNFILRVEPAALTDDTVISETEIPLIEQAIEISSQIGQYISEARNNAQVSENAATLAEEAAERAEIANANVQAKASQIDGATAAANTAAQNAQNIADDVAGKLERGELKGDKGEKGDKGDPGESGVYTPVDGFFTMYVDAAGDLWVASNTDMTGSWEYDSATGDLYYLTDDGT